MTPTAEPAAPQAARSRMERDQRIIARRARRLLLANLEEQHSGLTAALAANESAQEAATLMLALAQD